MIGEGPMLEQCKALAGNLGISHAIEFLGAQNHSVVESEMQNARSFVQHSEWHPRETAKVRRFPFWKQEQRDCRLSQRVTREFQTLLSKGKQVFW